MQRVGGDWEIEHKIAPNQPRRLAASTQLLVGVNRLLGAPFGDGQRLVGGAIERLRYAQSEPVVVPRGGAPLPRSLWRTFSQES